MQMTSHSCLLSQLELARAARARARARAPGLALPMDGLQRDQNRAHHSPCPSSSSFIRTILAADRTVRWARQHDDASEVPLGHRRCRLGKVLLALLLGAAVGDAGQPARYARSAQEGLVEARVRVEELREPDHAGNPRGGLARRRVAVLLVARQVEKQVRRDERLAVLVQERHVLVGKGGKVLRHQLGLVAILRCGRVPAVDAGELDVRSLLLVAFGAHHLGRGVGGVEVLEEEVVDVVRSDEVGDLTHGVDLGLGRLVERRARHHPKPAVAHPDGDATSADGQNAKAAERVVERRDLGRHLLDVYGRARGAWLG
ncbi:hypothetical protein L1887_42056 [Cichorium endivia]|nr:hypothetical protein L1887_42056 [Cichorium endivia]